MARAPAARSSPRRVVKELNLEAPGKLEVSTADATLCQL
jgi:hypothetical protein